MAQEEPELKRLKHSVISDHVYSSEFQQLFYDHWHNYSNVKKDNLEVISKPFRICKISNFLCNEDFMEEIKNELLDVKSRRNSMDLYQFEQTSELAYVDTKNMKLLYETFQMDLATWMERNTKIELNKMSMSSSCYSDTDYLLCHDDNLRDRRIAYILYLSKNWTVEDGGALDLFDTDDSELPRNVVKSLVPEYNSLVFFEVVHNSYHQVAEITSPDKSRWTINGWFHGPPRECNERPRAQAEPKNYIEPTNTRVDLKDWISKCYLFPGIVKGIQQAMEQESFAFLSDFLREDIYQRLSADLSSDAIVWQKVGPADIRNYEVAKEETLPELLRNFYNIFKSISIFQLLKDYTELDLVPEKETMNPKMVIELQRWSKGCYTLICDGSNDFEFSMNEKKSNGCISQNEERQEDLLDGPRTSKGSRDCQEKSVVNSGNRSVESGCGTPVSNKDDEDIDEDEILKKMLKGKSPRPKKKNLSQQSSSSRLENPSPQKAARVLDTDDSDVSDIGDYLSDPLDCSLECSDQEEDMDDANASEPGALDVIIQFHTGHVPEEDTIDYVDSKEQEGALIRVPAEDNHLCLVYKTVGTTRLHKYVNHYCTEYFYSLVCTYYE